MKEKDYIAATNLTKVRIALRITRDILLDNKITTEDQLVIINILHKWEAVLVKRTDT
jgi:hypothetical protein